MKYKLIRRKGFSLIELLMVVAIIGIIATIAIPLLMSARRNALDEKARGCVRTVLSAQQTFFASNGSYGTFDDLTLDEPPFLDKRFSGTSADLGHGLTVSIELGNSNLTFTVTASNPNGRWDYVGDQTMLIWEN